MFLAFRSSHFRRPRPGRMSPLPDYTLHTPQALSRSQQHLNLDGPKFAGYRSKTKGVVGHRERAAGREFGVAGSIPVGEAPYLRRYLPI
jgi:hypothetical protein